MLLKCFWHSLRWHWKINIHNVVSRTLQKHNYFWSIMVVSQRQSNFCRCKFVFMSFMFVAIDEIVSNMWTTPIACDVISFVPTNELKFSEFCSQWMTDYFVEPHPLLSSALLSRAVAFVCIMNFFHLQPSSVDQFNLDLEEGLARYSVPDTYTNCKNYFLEWVGASADIWWRRWVRCPIEKNEKHENNIAKIRRWNLPVT